MTPVTQREIDTAVKFFSGKDIPILERQAREFNTAQPSFTALVFAWEKDGIPRFITEDILKSIFVVYYVYAKLRGLHIEEISAGRIAKTLESFTAFLQLYTKEKADADGMDVCKMQFINDTTVLKYGAESLAGAFGDAGGAPNHVLMPYFALLKAIELGAEKAERGKGE